MAVAVFAGQVDCGGYDRASFVAAGLVTEEREGGRKKDHIGKGWALG